MTCTSTPTTVSRTPRSCSARPFVRHWATRADSAFRDALVPLDEGSRRRSLMSRATSASTRGSRPGRSMLIGGSQGGRSRSQHSVFRLLTSAHHGNARLPRPNLSAPDSGFRTRPAPHRRCVSSRRWHAPPRCDCVRSADRRRHTKHPKVLRTSCRPRLRIGKHPLGRAGSRPSRRRRRVSTDARLASDADGPAAVWGRSRHACQAWLRLVGPEIIAARRTRGRPTRHRVGHQGAVEVASSIGADQDAHLVWLVEQLDGRRLLHMDGTPSRHPTAASYSRVSNPTASTSCTATECARCQRRRSGASLGPNMAAIVSSRRWRRGRLVYPVPPRKSGEAGAHLISNWARRELARCERDFLTLAAGEKGPDRMEQTRWLDYCLAKPGAAGRALGR